MIKLKVFRHQMQNENDLLRIIDDSWNHSGIIKRGAFGLNTISTHAMVAGFEQTHNAFCRMERLYAHYFAISFDKMIPEAVVNEQVNFILNKFTSEFQLIYMIAQDFDGNRELGIIINAISYLNGKKFHDNNRVYEVLIKEISEACRTDYNVQIGSGVLFAQGQSNSNCYQTQY